MKKFRYIISALTLLVASATAHAQVFDVTITPTDGSTVFSKTSATSIEIKPGDESPIHVFSGGSDEYGESLTVAHCVRYDFALTPVNTINPGSGNLPEGNFPAQAPRRTVAEAPSFTEPELTGPALVLMREELDPIIYYAEDATEGRIKLKCNPNGQYMVGNVVEDKVIAVFYKDPHSFQVVKDENNKATWTWAKDYSTATLNVSCTHNGCSVNDNQTVNATSEVTTLPTTTEEGVLTSYAKVTYNEFEYVGTKTATIEKLPAEDKAISGNVTPANNSVTVINASNTVTAGQPAPTITVTAGTAENPNTANIIITGENTDAKVNVIVHENATVNIYGDGKAKVSGKIEVESGGKMDLSGATVDGSITASGGTLNVTGGTINGSITASAGAAVTLSNTNVTSITGAAITVTDGGHLVLGKGTYTGKEGEGAFVYSDVANITPEPALTLFFDGLMVGAIAPKPNIISGAKGRRTNAQVKKSLYDSYTVCDATHTDANFTGQKTFMSLNSTELTGFYVCDDGCGTTSATPTYSRTMANKWGTLVLPFSVTIDNTKPYDFYTVSGVTSTELTLTKVETGPIAAGTPVLVRINAEEVDAATSKTYTLTLTAPAKSVSTTITNPTAVDGLTLTGTYAVAEVTNGYIIGNDAFHNAATLKGKDELWNAIAAEKRHVYCQPFRAYLAGTLSNQNGAPARLTIGTGNGDDTTALEAIEAITEGDATGTEPVEYFDMNGRRIDDLQQGVNIVKRGSKTYKVIIK